MFFIILLFFVTHTAPPDIYTLSLHDALPISRRRRNYWWSRLGKVSIGWRSRSGQTDYADDDEDDRISVADRKSTRLNSSHRCISYAVFCLKKKKKIVNIKKNIKHE